MLLFVADDEVTEVGGLAVIDGGGFQNVCALADDTVWASRPGWCFSGGDVAGVHYSDDDGATWYGGSKGAYMERHMHLAGIWPSRNTDGLAYALISQNSLGGDLWIGRTTDGGVSGFELDLVNGTAAVQQGGTHPRQVGHMLCERQGGTEVIMGSGKGLWRFSTWAGESTVHTQVGGIDTETITGVTPDPNNDNIAYCTADASGGVWRINNAFSGTATATQLSSSLTDAQGCVAVDESGTTVLYVAAGTGGVHKCTNAGTASGTGTASWTDITGTLSGVTSWTAIDGMRVGGSATHVVVGAVNPPSPYECVFKTENGGTSWTHISPDANVNDTIYDANGINWWIAIDEPGKKLDASGHDTLTICIDRNDPDHILLSGRSGLWHTFNNGTDWYPPVKHLGASIDWSVFVDPTNFNRVGVSSTDWKTHFTTDKWASTPVSSAPAGVDGSWAVYDLFYNPTEGVVTAVGGDRDTNTEGDLAYTSNPWAATPTWTLLGNPEGGVKRVIGGAYGADASSNPVALAVCDNGAGIYRRVNTGSWGAWTQVYAVAFPTANTRKAKFLWQPGSQHVWCWYPETGLYYSSDYGATWLTVVTVANIGDGLSPGEHEGAIAHHSSAETTIWLGANGAVYRITNCTSALGTITSYEVTDPGWRIVSGIAVNANGVAVSNNPVAAGQAPELWVTTDNGSTWTDQATDGWKNIAIIPFELAIEQTGTNPFVYAALDGSGTIRQRVDLT